MNSAQHSATLSLHRQNSPGVVDRRVFGGFLEHLGRAVYEGVYDPGNPRSDRNGFRTDVIEALRPLGFSVMRYPGGNYVSAADWRDGVGPKQSRPRRPDFAWRSVESHQFGTDEFMQWCTLMNIAPMLAVNLGTQGPEEAAQLLEYCNLPGGTYWADRRIANGHADPYGVKLWCLGNEMDGPWQANFMPAAMYAQKAFAAASMLKGMDPTVETVLCGSTGGPATYMEWDRVAMEWCWDKIDYLSAHLYSTNYNSDAPWFLAEGVAIDRLLADFGAAINFVRARKRSAKQVYLSFDEWNVWYRARGGAAENGNWTEAPHLLEEIYNLEDALVVAQYLAAFVRRADLVKIACIAQIVNVIAPILTSPTGVLVQSIYWPFVWFSRYAAGRTSLTPMIDGPTYVAGARGEVPVLDAAAVYDERGNVLTAFLINRGAMPLSVTIDLVDRPLARLVSVDAIAGSDLKAFNSFDRPDAVRPSTLPAMVNDGRASIDLPATSFACIRCAASE